MHCIKKKTREEEDDDDDGAIWQKAEQKNVSVSLILRCDHLN